MRMTQEQLDEYTQRQSRNTPQNSHVAAVTHSVLPDKQAVGVTPAKGVKGVKLNEAQKKSLVVVLPFKLPTWNALLAMGVWQRKKERDRIHAAVLRCIANAKG